MQGCQPLTTVYRIYCKWMKTTLELRTGIFPNDFNYLIIKLIENCEFNYLINILIKKIRNTSPNSPELPQNLN
jgi:hypothetical protein